MIDELNEDMGATTAVKDSFAEFLNVCIHLYITNIIELSMYECV